jgi:hypothetical protein
LRQKAQNDRSQLIRVSAIKKNMLKPFYYSLMEGKVESFLEIIKHTVFLYSKHISKAVASKIGQEIRAQQDQRLLVGAIFQIMEQ